MGIRRAICQAGGGRHRSLRAQARSNPLRYCGDIRLGPQRANPWPCPRGEPGIGLPRDEAGPGRAQRPGGKAARCSQRETARSPPPRPLPGALAESAGARQHDHARHALPAEIRTGRRSGRQQLLPGALARRRGKAAEPGPVQPGPVQPRGPLARARLAAVRRGAWPRHHCLQPAGTGDAFGQVSSGPACPRTISGPPVQCSSRRTWSAPTI